MEIGKLLERGAWLLAGAIVFPAFLVTAILYPIWEDWGKNL